MSGHYDKGIRLNPFDHEREGGKGDPSFDYISLNMSRYVTARSKISYNKICFFLLIRSVGIKENRLRSRDRRVCEGGVCLSFMYFTMFVSFPFVLLSNLRIRGYFLGVNSRIYNCKDRISIT